MIARHNEDISPEMAEIADRLEAARLRDAAASVRRAARVVKTDPLLAEEILREAADDIMAMSPAYSYRRKPVVR
jgi:hypothetical protein